MSKQSAPTPQYGADQGVYQQYQQPQQGNYQPQYQQQQQAGGYQPQQQYQQPQQQYQAPPTKYEGQQAVTGTAAPLMTQTQVGTPIYEDCSPILAQKFITQGPKDVWAAVLFIIQLIVMAVIAIYNSKKHDITLSFGSNTEGDRRSERYFAFAFFLAVGICFCMMGLMRIAAKAYIWAANLFSIGLMLGLAVYCISRGSGMQYTAAIFVIIALIHAVWLYFARRRIPFAGVLLSYSVKTVVTNWGTIIMSFFQLIVLIVYFVGFIVMVVPTLNNMENTSSNYDESGSIDIHCTAVGSASSQESCWESGSGVGNNNNSGSGKLYAVCLAFLLMWYWSVQVFTNVVHVTASGTVATWFFAGEQSMPRTPTIASARRAMTTSFGSICFGSLLVAILKLIHTMLRNAARRGGFFACIAACLIGFIERLLEYFNVYAFTHVAIYGMSYIEAGKATWAMIKNCGWAALFNDNLVYPVLSMTCLVDSIAIGVVLGVASGSIILGILCFLISYVVHMIILRVVYSGIVTIFVCFAEAEDVLNSTNPQFYQEIQAARDEMNQSTC